MMSTFRGPKRARGEKPKKKNEFRTTKFIVLRFLQEMQERFSFPKHVTREIRCFALFCKLRHGNLKDCRVQGCLHHDMKSATLEKPELDPLKATLKLQCRPPVFCMAENRQAHENLTCNND